MAVVSGTRSNTLFIGLSSDSKPAAQVDFAAQFYESDTGKTYIWTGSNRQSPDLGQWVEYFQPPTQPLDSASAQL